jgi:hypothetical protein
VPPLRAPADRGAADRPAAERRVPDLPSVDHGLQRDRGRDLGRDLVDVSRPPEARREGTKADLPPPPTLRWDANGDCVGGEKVVGGGGACPGAAILKSAANGNGDGWEVLCDGGIPKVEAACLTSPFPVTAAPGAGGLSATATCATGELVGGSCSCPAGGVSGSYSYHKNKSWVCSCGQGTAYAHAYCAQGSIQLSETTCTFTNEPQLTAIKCTCPSGTTLFIGGCQSDNELRQSIRDVPGLPNTWRCFAKGTGSVRVLCWKAP